MLKLSRLTDYGTVVLAHMARAPDQRHRASDLAVATRLGEATVRKLLKRFLATPMKKSDFMLAIMLSRLTLPTLRWTARRVTTPPSSMLATPARITTNPITPSTVLARSQC